MYRSVDLLEACCEIRKVESLKRERWETRNNEAKAEVDSDHGSIVKRTATSADAVRSQGHPEGSSALRG